MTNDVKTKLEEFSLGIIGSLKAGVRPFTMQYSSSQIGLGDFCAFAGSTISHLVNNGTISVAEKKESAAYMVSVFMKTFGHNATFSELNEFSDMVLEQNVIDKNFAGIVAAIKFAR